MLIILYAIMIGWSIYGNVMVLMIVRKTRSLQNVNNLLVSNLAICDIILSTVCTPFKFHSALIQRWDLPEVMCKLCPYIENVCINLQVLILVLIAHERYVKWLECLLRVMLCKKGQIAAQGFRDNFQFLCQNFILPNQILLKAHD